jgi:hypothetical protein
MCSYRYTVASWLMRIAIHHHLSNYLKTRFSTSESRFHLKTRTV